MVRRNVMVRRTIVMRTEHGHCQEYAMNLVRRTEHGQEELHGQEDYSHED
jgi:hypothetical protein